MSKPLTGTIAVVAGAARGTGRGIAVALGEAGATVYCTGTNSPRQPGAQNRPETITETADLVTRSGGRGIAKWVDHSVPSEVVALFEEVGAFDLLVNDLRADEELTEWGRRLWETRLSHGLSLIDRELSAHIITNHCAVPKLRTGGLIVELTDGDGFFFRGHCVYDLVKTALIRSAFALSEEVKPRGLSVVAVTPGFLRSEWLLDHLRVTEATWRDAAAEVPELGASETPLFVGRCIAALAADPQVSKKSGRVHASWDLAEEYGVDDADGSRPHFLRWLSEHRPTAAARWRQADDGFYAYWGPSPYDAPQ